MSAGVGCEVVLWVALAQCYPVVASHDAPSTHSEHAVEQGVPAVAASEGEQTTNTHHHHHHHRHPPLPKVPLTGANIAAFAVLSVFAVLGAVHVFGFLVRASCKCALCRGEYGIEGELDGGGSGTVFVVTRAVDHRQFVLKKIYVRTLNHANVAQEEAKELRTLRHRAIVRYEDDFIHTERLKNGISPMIFVCIVMEWCDMDLADLVLHRRESEAGPFCEDDVLFVLVGLCSALRHCHHRRIAHRDVKSRNVFLTSHGQVRLGDFGLARKMLTDGHQVSHAGTNCYMSPEMFASTGSVDGPKADVWSLGLCLFELMSLGFVFERQTDVIGAQFAMDPGAAERLLGELPPAYSPGLVALVRQMLQVEPTHRPSADAILRTPLVRDAEKRLRGHALRTNYRRGARRRSSPR